MSAAREPRYLAGLVGAGIRASLAPALHEREAAELGLRCRYELIDLDDLGLGADDAGDIVERARRLGYRGLNVTHPCKRSVMGHLDAFSPESADIGAVNTIVFEAGVATGHNTDRYGFERSFRDGLPDVRPERVVLLGAGGAGAAVAHALLRLGARHIDLIDIDRRRAGELVDRLRPRFGDRVTAVEPDRLAACLAGADGLVNATTVGMRSHPGSPVPHELLRPALWVADVVYRPLETELLARAGVAGCRTLGGGGMAVLQAARALHVFTGLRPNEERMLRHFEGLVACEGR
jgi:shikimate dehydrogenase